MVHRTPAGPVERLQPVDGREQHLPVRVLDAAERSRGRPHQGLGNEVIAPEASDDSPTGTIVETERLGGLLRSYDRAA